MEYRQLGRSGLQVSAVGLGTNTFGRNMTESQAALILARCLEVGINFIDTADTYGRGISEEKIGAGIEGRRNDYIIATKAGGGMGEGPNRAGASRQHLVDSVNDSLRRLLTDYLDLFQVHYPDPKTPIE